MVMQQIAMRKYPLLIIFAPRAPLFKRNLIGPIASKDTPKKIGDEDSNRFKNLGAPKGGSNLVGALEVFIHFTHEEIIGRIIFFA